jgi:hypothetical protein
MPNIRRMGGPEPGIVQRKIALLNRNEKNT